MPRSRNRATLLSSEAASTTRSARPNWFSSACEIGSAVVWVMFDILSNNEAVRANVFLQALPFEIAILAA